MTVFEKIGPIKRLEKIYTRFGGENHLRGKNLKTKSPLTTGHNQEK